MRVVIDTNVLVSAMLSPYGAPAQVVRLVLQGDLVPLHDQRILAEYRAVLARERFGFEAEEVRVVVDAFERSGETVFSTPLSPTLPDPDDLPFLEVAVAGRADALVTGNASHFVPGRGSTDVPVVSPRELLDQLRGQVDR